MVVVVLVFYTSAICGIGCGYNRISMLGFLSYFVRVFFILVA